MDANKLLTAVEHVLTGAENAASTAPSGSPHAMGWFARARALIAEMRGEETPPPPAGEDTVPAADPVVANPDGEPVAPPPPADPADTSADAMNTGEAAALDQQSGDQNAQSH